MQMGLFDKLMGEFIDIIEWVDDSNDTMVYRFERYGNEIKYGAKLTVRESQIAIFVNEGQIADVFKPGMYELETANMPILSTLQHWDHGFSSPFKAEVYFFNLRRFTDLKWGTKNPIMLRDKEFGAVRLRAFGTYNIKISDPKRFLLEIVGTDGYFTIDEISDQLRNLILTKLATTLGRANIPILDLAANYEKLGNFIEQKIAPDFKELGLELSNFLIENISLPQNVEEALDKRSSMGIIGDIDSYLKYQSAESLTNANSGASEAMGMGMGFAMASNFANNFSQNHSTSSPPPLPKSKKYHLAINNEAKGPFEMSEIEQFVKEKKVDKNTLAWSEGMSGWKKMSEIDELKELFSLVPPPLPKSS
jgi:membrane protease subunit (stomatin/prohibitin family)